MSYSAEEPPAKKCRSEETSTTSTPSSTTSETSSSPLQVFSPHVLNNAAQYAKTYQNAKPYSHGVLEELFVTGFADKVLHEVKHNLKCKYKESDLFRVYQSIDLANLSNQPIAMIDPQSQLQLVHNMPNMMTLKNALYSPEWRLFIEQIANLPKGTLTDQVDCAINCHDKGCHLLCHDDVIGTRRVSYILYFTDSEPDWNDEDGGRLELYESIVSDDNGDNHGDTDATATHSNVRVRVPGVFPVKTVLPKFNSMAYFAVEPGVSFHSVQEVFCDRPRLSIQGWYHAKEMPKEMEHASLNQLKTTNVLGEHDFEGDFTPMLSADVSTDTRTNNNNINTNNNNTDTNININMELTNEDKDFLSQYISKTYLRPESIQEICSRFEEDSSVQLRHFFNLEWERKVSKLLKTEDERCNFGRDQPSLDYAIGVTKEWVPVGPAHKQRFLEYVGGATEDGETCGSVLKYLKEQIMQSPEFGRLLKSYTSLGMPLGYRGRVRRFRPGLDYTIAHYGILTQSAVLDATMCFVSGQGDQSIGNEDDNEDDMLWQSDDKGGFECYIAADDEEEGDNEADDEYNEEDDTKLLSVSACNNTLSLVYRDPGTMRFVKYLGIGAPSSRWDLSLEYEVEEDDEESEENDAVEKEGDVDVGF